MAIKIINNHRFIDKNHICDLDVPISILVNGEANVNLENQGIFNLMALFLDLGT